MTDAESVAATRAKLAKNPKYAPLMAELGTAPAQDYAIKKAIDRRTSDGTRTPPPRDAGPGTELRELLRELGLTPTTGCACEDRVRAMNSYGIEGCQTNRAEIEDWLRAEGRRTSWAKKLKALILSALHDIPISSATPESSLLDEALRRATVKEAAK